MAIISSKQPTPDADGQEHDDVLPLKTPNGGNKELASKNQEAKGAAVALEIDKDAAGNDATGTAATDTDDSNIKPARSASLLQPNSQPEEHGKQEERPPPSAPCRIRGAKRSERNSGYCHSRCQSSA
jgi:hypothetical protein